MASSNNKMAPDEVEVVFTEAGKLKMRGAVISRELDPMEAIRPDAPRPLQLAVLRRYIGLKVREIAFVASVTEQSVGNWKKFHTPGRPPAYDDLRAVVERMMQTSTDPILIGSWLRSRNDGLDYQRPLDLLKAGEFEQVMAATEDFLAISSPSSD